MQGVHPCDQRRSISEYKPLFPAIDFSLASAPLPHQVIKCLVYYLVDYPTINLSELLTDITLTFMQIENEDDILWKADTREKNEEVAARGKKFLDW